MATTALDIARLHFPCPHCGKGLKAEPAKAGRKARCNGCGKTVAVPGLSEPPPRPTLDIADLAPGREPLDEVDLEDDDAAKSGDASAGPASLYLGGVNFVLFLSVAMMAGFLFQFNYVGLALLGVLGLSGLLMSWRGWRLAQEARRLADATGQGIGYAIAGRWSHGLIAANYICVLALVGVGVYQIAVLQKQMGGGLGLGNIGDMLKPIMDGNKELNKLIKENENR